MSEGSQERPKLWTPEDLAEFAQVPLATIYQWRARGGGPAGFRVGRHIRYTEAAVLTWLQGRELREDLPDPPTAAPVRTRAARRYVPNMLTMKPEPVWTSPVTVTMAAGTVKTEVTYRP